MKIIEGLLAPREHSEKYLFLLWLILAGWIVFGLIVLTDQGVIRTIIRVDRSFLSMIIGLIFVGASIFCGIQIFRLSREIDLVESLPRTRRPKANDLPPSILKRYMVEKARMGGKDSETLLQEMNTTMIGHCEIGWLSCDILIKLGLVGTLIGFIIMLTSVGQSASLAIEDLRAILEHMSSGMRIALYTTLSGLSGSILLTVQYYILERGIDLLHARIRTRAI